MALRAGCKFMTGRGRHCLNVRTVDTLFQLSPGVLRTNVRLLSEYFPLNDDVYGFTDDQKQVSFRCTS